MLVKVKAHAATARKIAAVGPLIAAGKMLAPDAGLVLVLDDADESKQTWLSDRASTMPVVGDWFIQDADLNLTYFVPASKFTSMFEETKP